MRELFKSAANTSGSSGGYLDPHGAGGAGDDPLGGAYDPATNTWGQGAFNADDLTRASVVYLRHWRQFGDDHSRRLAYQLLRGVTYLQTSSGPNAGNVVLWMQPDGSLNLTPTPPDNPNPSDTGPSYWLARAIWALGAGYAAFRSSARSRRSRAFCAPAWTSRWTPRTAGSSTRGSAPTRWSTGDAGRPGGSSSAPTPPPRPCTAWSPTSGPAPTPAPAATSPAWPPASRRCRSVTPGSGRSGRSCPRACPVRSGTPGPTRWPARWPRPAACADDATGSGLRPARWAASPPTCWPRAAPRTAGCRHRPTGPRSPTAPTPPCKTCSAKPRPPAGPPSATWPGSLPPGTSATTRPGWRCTTRPPGGPSTGSAPTGPSTTTPGPSRPSTGCCPCSPWTPGPTSPPAPGWPGAARR